MEDSQRGELLSGAASSPVCPEARELEGRGRKEGSSWRFFCILLCSIGFPPFPGHSSILLLLYSAIDSFQCIAYLCLFFTFRSFVNISLHFLNLCLHSFPKILNHLLLSLFWILFWSAVAYSLHLVVFLQGLILFLHLGNNPISFIWGSFLCDCGLGLEADDCSSYFFSMSAVC